MCSFLKNYFPFSEAFLDLDFSLLIFRTSIFSFLRKYYPSNQISCQKCLWTFLQMNNLSMPQFT